MLGTSWLRAMSYMLYGSLLLVRMYVVSFATEIADDFFYSAELDAGELHPMVSIPSATLSLSMTLLWSVRPLELLASGCSRSMRMSDRWKTRILDGRAAYLALSGSGLSRDLVLGILFSLGSQSCVWIVV